MALKDLISEIKGEQEKEAEYYLSVVINRTSVSSGIWKISKNRAWMVALGTLASWTEDTSELVKAVDDSISSAIAQIEEIIEPDKVVFGLPPTWVSEGEIKKEALERLRIICEKLDLKSTGYVVVPDAVVHWIKSQEGAPPDIILVGIEEEEIDVTLVKTGKVEGINTVARSMSLVDDVKEGLMRFRDVGNLPSRILVYNHRESEIEEAKQLLLAADWSNLPFLHNPKTGELNPDLTVFAVSLAGATEIGKVERLEEEIKNLPEERKSQQPQIEEKAEEEIKQEENVTEIEESQPDITAFDLGFSKEDVALGKQKENLETGENLEVREPVEEEHKKIESKPRISFGIFLPLLNRLKIKIAGFGRSPRKLILLPFLLLFILGPFFVYLAVLKANIRIFVSPKKIGKDFTLIVDTAAGGVDLNQKIISGNFVSTEVSGDKTKSTTGSKIVGDRAKGAIKILNTGDSIKLSAGTKIIGPGDLKFTLDEDIEVASGSGILNPGQGNGNVTAEDIGSDYNLAAGSMFSIGNFSTQRLQGTNEAAFSGGTSRTVAAVSKDDQAFLEKDLTNELTQKAKDQLKASQTNTQALVSDSEVVDIIAKNFSKNVGEEAETVKLTLKLRVSMLRISQEDVNQIVKEEIRKDIPKEFLLREDLIETKMELQEKTKNKFTFKVSSDASLLPIVDKQQFAKSIAGRDLAFAKDAFLGIPGYSRSEIILQPKLPSRLARIPLLVKNIQIEILPEY